jgi:hypothetical protein
MHPVWPMSMSRMRVPSLTHCPQSHSRIRRRHLVDPRRAKWRSMVAVGWNLPGGLHARNFRRSFKANAIFPLQRNKTESPAPATPEARSEAETRERQPWGNRVLLSALSQRRSRSCPERLISTDADQGLTRVLFPQETCDHFPTRAMSCSLLSRVLALPNCSRGVPDEDASQLKMVFRED